MAFHVLIASDGSASATAALTTAVRFPWPIDASASAVVAKQPVTMDDPSLLMTALDRTASLVAERTMHEMAKRWPGAEARIVDAAPVEGILREAERRRASVIVMGWRGHGAVSRRLMGSVSRGVVRGATCPVLVVRRVVQDLRRVVVGFDGSPDSVRAAELIAALVRPQGGRVTVVNSADIVHVALALVPQESRAAVDAQVERINEARLEGARKALDGALAPLGAAGWKVDPLVTEGAPLDDLLETVADTRADLLVVGAKGAADLRYLRIGSVAEGALNRCPVPVLIVR